MAVSAKNFGKIALVALGVVGMATPIYTMAQDAPAPLTDAEVTASRALFSQYGCSACHAFADGGGTGHIGPSLDGNASLTVDYVTQTVSNGQGAMPSFGGMLSEQQLATLARYIVEKKR
ncbi:MAG: cytochrome c [Erythrobacter sp.]|nr:cytochrome c [Erythrobacter sp.]